MVKVSKTFIFTHFRHGHIFVTDKISSQTSAFLYITVRYQLFHIFKNRKLKIKNVQHFENPKIMSQHVDPKIENRKSKNSESTCRPKNRKSKIKNRNWKLKIQHILTFFTFWISCVLQLYIGMTLYVGGVRNENV